MEEMADLNLLGSTRLDISEEDHIDTWLDQVKIRITSEEARARLFLEIQRMPAWKKAQYMQILDYFVFAKYQDKWVRVQSASRLGDVLVSYDLQRMYGKTEYVLVKYLSNWQTIEQDRMANFGWMIEDLLQQTQVGK